MTIPTPPNSLLLYTTSQTPLSPRYPSPSKPPCLIPPLLHTSLHEALDRKPPSWSLEDGKLFIPNPADIPHSGVDKVNGNGIVNGNGAQEDDVQPDDEVTLRFYLTSSTSSPSIQLSQISTGVSLFHAHKKWKNIDTFLVGWKEVNYVGQPPKANEILGAGCGGMKLESLAEKEREEEEWVGEKKQIQMKKLWDALPSILPNVDQIGTMSLPLPLLRLLSSDYSPNVTTSSTPTHPTSPRQVDSSTTTGEDGSESTATGSTNDVHPSTNAHATAEDRQLLSEMPKQLGSGVSHSPHLHFNGLNKKVKPPAVNRLNTPDCHSLPRDLLSFAKERGISLWAGGSGEGSDPLPSKHLHNTLAEFIPQFPSSFLPANTKLGTIVPFEEEGMDRELGVDVEWVIAYTVVSRTRNVVRDKGYMISAKLL